MKKFIVGVAAVGVMMALRPLVTRRVIEKMRSHCKEMMEVRGDSTGHEANARKMREHCGEMVTQQHRTDAEPVVAA